jgi:hypothetical protein
MIDMLPVTERTSRIFLVYVEVVLPSIKFLPPHSQLSIYTIAKLNQFFTPDKD